MSYNDILSSFLNYFEIAQNLNSQNTTNVNIVNVQQITTVQNNLQASNTYYDNVLQQPFYSTPGTDAIGTLAIETKAALDTVSYYSSTNMDTNLLPVATLDNLLLSFGFTMLNLPYYMKQAILTNLVQNYTIKGTMQSIFNMLNDIVSVPINISELYFEKWCNYIIPIWEQFSEIFPSCLAGCMSILDVTPYSYTALEDPNIFYPAEPVIINTNSTTGSVPYLNIMFYNNNNSVFYPDNVYTNPSQNSFTYELINNESVSTIVLNPNFVYNSNQNTTSYIINHNLNWDYVSLTCYNYTSMIIPDNVEIIDENNLLLEVINPIENLYVAINSDANNLYYLYKSIQPETNLTIRHNLNQLFVDVTCYNNTNLIIPDSIIAEDVNTLSVTFNQPIMAIVFILASNLSTSACSTEIINITNTYNPSQTMVYTIQGQKILAFSYTEPYNIPGSNGYLTKYADYSDVIDKHWMLTVDYLVEQYPYNKAMSPYFILELLCDMSTFIYGTSLLKQYSFQNYLAYLSSGLSSMQTYYSTRNLVSDYLPNPYNYLEGYLTVRYLWCIIGNINNDISVNYIPNSDTTSQISENGKPIGIWPQPIIYVNTTSINLISEFYNQFGIFAGGLSPDGNILSSTNIYIFTSNTTQPGNNLAYTSYGLAGTGNANIGIFGGGNTFSSGTVFTCLYNYETDISSYGTNLLYSVYSLGACSNSINAIFSQGIIADNILNRTNIYNYSNNTVTYGNNLTYFSYNLTASGNQSIGLFGGGTYNNFYYSTTSLYSYSNNSVTIGSNLSYQTSNLAATGNSVMAIFGGGLSGTYNVLSNTSIYTYSNNSVNNGNNLQQQTSDLAATGNSVMAIFGGGFNINTATNISTISEYNYSTNVITNVNTLSNNLYDAATCSPSSNGLT